MLITENVNQELLERTSELDHGLLWQSLKPYTERLLRPFENIQTLQLKLKSEIHAIQTVIVVWQLIQTLSTLLNVGSVRTLSPGIYEAWWLRPSFHLTKTGLLGFEIAVPESSVLGEPNCPFTEESQSLSH